MKTGIYIEPSPAALEIRHYKELMIEINKACRDLLESAVAGDKADLVSFGEMRGSLKAYANVFALMGQIALKESQV